MPLLCRIPVHLPSQRYDVFIGSRHLDRLGGLVKRLRCGTDPVLVTNPQVLRGAAQRVIQVLKNSGMPVKALTIGDTERAKSIRTLSKLLHALAQVDGPGRRLFLLLVGGGVVGDVGGLAAGLYRRGIPYIQIPTSLLAQVDSSIGGKTGIDLPQGKNLAGLFYQPSLVFIELDFLKSLSQRQFRSGLAEVAKAAVVRDPRLFDLLERSPLEDLSREDLLGLLIARSVRVKVSVVQEDERESKGIRTILNFGHTLGHALEAATGFTRLYTHGEAVALGMAVATDISLRMGKIADSDAKRITGLLAKLQFPLRIRGGKPSEIFRAMAHDKKWTSGPHRWVLPTGIGRVVVEEVPEAIARETLIDFLEG